MKKLLLLSVIVASAWSQTPPPYNLQISQQPLPLVTGAFANYTGTVGQLTYFYWIIARYGVGNSPLNIPVQVSKVDPTGSVAIGWSAPASPTGYTLAYDVLRTTSNQFPATGTCTSCLVSSTTTGTTATDTLGALSNYTLNTYTPQPNPVILTLDNINASTVLLKGILNGSNIIPISLGCTATSGIWYNLSGVPTCSSALQFDGTSINFGSTGGITANGNAIRIHPISGNTIASLQIFPSGTMNTSRNTLFNTSDVLNAGFIRYQIIAGAVVATVGLTGTGSSPTSYQIGEETSGAGALPSVDFMFAGVKQLGINKNGSTSPLGVTFANINVLAPVNGMVQYCSDCTVTSGVDDTCTSGGTGALALRLNGAWKCDQ